MLVPSAQPNFCGVGSKREIFFYDLFSIHAASHNGTPISVSALPLPPALIIPQPVQPTPSRGLQTSALLSPRPHEVFRRRLCPTYALTRYSDGGPVQPTLERGIQTAALPTHSRSERALLSQPRHRPPNINRWFPPPKRQYRATTAARFCSITLPWRDPLTTKEKGSLAKYWLQPTNSNLTTPLPPA